MSDTDAVLAAIDGALADPELPDGMRWSPEPEQAANPHAVAFDGEAVPQPLQRYERATCSPRLAPLSLSGQPWEEMRERARTWAPDLLAPEGLVSGIAIRAASEADARRFYEAARRELRQPSPTLAQVLSARLAADPEGTAEALAHLWDGLAQALRPVMEAISSVMRDLGRAAAAARPAPPEPAEDPRARALRLRQQRSTGPDRQVQHRPRPRRHQP